MGEIRYITDHLEYPKSDDFESHEQFKKAIETLNGTIGALKELKERISNLEEWEGKHLNESIRHNRLRVVHICINWVDFASRDETLSETERREKLHAIIEDLRAYSNKIELLT